MIFFNFFREFCEDLRIASEVFNNKTKWGFAILYIKISTKLRYVDVRW